MSSLVLENNNTKMVIRYNLAQVMKKQLTQVISSLLASYCLVLCVYAGQSNAAPSDAKPIALQSMKLAALSGSETLIRFNLSQPIHNSHVKSFVTKNPPRIILDLIGVKNSLQQRKRKIDAGMAYEVLAVEAGGRTRIVLELRQSTGFRLDVHGSQVDLIIAGKSIAAKAGQARFAKPNAIDASQLVSLATTKHAITGVDFRKGDARGGRIIVNISDPKISVDVSIIGGALVANFLDTGVKKSLQRYYDVGDFATPVTNFTVTPEGKNTQIRIETKHNYEHLAYQVDNQFIIDVKPVSEETALLERLKKPRYKGKRLSLNFQDIQVRAVLQLLAEFTGMNVVISDAVRGSMSLRLNNVPWDQALDIILKTRGLDKREVGNVMLIDRATDLAARERQELQALRQISDLEPVHTELIQLNYATATELSGLLAPHQGPSLLSESGSVSVDQRTNTLIVQDTPTKLREVRELISRIDVPVRQVLIEARVVNIEKNREKDLGVRFGITRDQTLSGTLTGANSMKANDEASSDVTLANRLNFDFAAGSSSGKIGLALAKLGSDVLLDLELSALETEGVAEIISSPKLITSDQQTAHILAGEEIPYLTASSSGATTVAFREAELRLEVTPQITPNNNILLSLQVNKDARGEEIYTGGPPAIDTREVQTQVLVSNGQTVVLGGVYEKTNRDDLQRVPLFGSLPVVGRLFRHNKVITNRTELLVFVTPKIVESRMFSH